MAPPVGVTAIVRLEVALPELLAADVVAGEVTVAEVCDDNLPVRYRGRASEVVEPIPPRLFAANEPAAPRIPGRDVAACNLLHPIDFAVVSIDSEQHQLVAVLARDEDRIAPNDRCTGAVR